MKRKRKRIEYQPMGMVEFGTSFHTTSTVPLLYTLRPPSGNSRHDVVFISSYVHDATFRADQIKVQGQTLVLPLVRSRWELFKHLDDLVTIPSELKINRVVSHHLEISDVGNFFRREPELIIGSVQHIMDKWEESDDQEIVINCVGHNKLRLRVRWDCRMSVIDRADNYEHSSGFISNLNKKFSVPKSVPRQRTKRYEVMRKEARNSILKLLHR